MARKSLHALVIGGAAAALTLGLWELRKLDSFEHTTWSQRVNAFAKKSATTDRIKVVLLDQKSLDWAAKEMALPWPWPRSVYVPIFDFLKRGGAASVSFDVLYTEGSGEDHVSEDQQLGEGFARLPSAAAVFLGSQTDQQTSWPPTVRRPALVPDGLRVPRAEPGAAFPVPEVATNAAVLASVKDEPDPDAIFRRACLFRTFDGVSLPTLGLAPLLLAGATNAHFDDLSFTVGAHRLPVDSKQRVLLRFRGPSGTHQAFSAAAVIQSEMRLQAGEQPTIDPTVFKGCHVFFGFSAPGLKDLRPTPVGGDYPGVEIHATLLDNLLAGDALRDAPRPAVALATLLLCLAAAGAVVASRTTAQNVVAMLVFLPLPYAAGFAGYALGWWWPIAVGEVGIALALAGGIVWNYATEGRQKRFIKSAFNQYVGGEVLDELVRDPSKLKLGGERRELTMFFSDLEKFSSFSEKLEPPRVIELLNVYLTEAGEVLTSEGAYVDKFVGDAIVAFWNAPIAQADHAVRAVRAALLCQRRCAAKRAEWEQQFGAVVKMRIGIGTGEVVVGNMGSRDKFNYTMLGDAANAASRLEGANKAFGTYTMVAEATWQQVGGQVRGRELGAITVVGRKAPMRVFEPLALEGEPLPAWLPEYERGLAAVRGRQWAEAAALFEAIADDPVSRTYAARCRELAAGTRKEWDGVWNLTEK